MVDEEIAGSQRDGPKGGPRSQRKTDELILTAAPCCGGTSELQQNQQLIPCLGTSGKWDNGMMEVEDESL